MLHKAHMSVEKIQFVLKEAIILWFDSIFDWVQLNILQTVLDDTLPLVSRDDEQKASRYQGSSQEDRGEEEGSVEALVEAQQVWTPQTRAAR